MSATAAAGASGDVQLATLHFHFGADSPGKLTTVTPNFTVVLLLRSLVGETLTGSFRINPNADANCNGKTEALDAQIILATIVGRPAAGHYCAGTIH